MKKKNYFLFIVVCLALCFSLFACNNSEKKVEITKLTAKPSEITVEVGKTADLKVEIEPKEAKDEKYTFKTLDEKIATVDKDGKVTGVKEGKTEITVKAEKGNAKTTVKVNVTKAAAEASFQLTDKDVEIVNKEPGSTIIKINSTDNTKKIVVDDVLQLLVAEDKDMGSLKFEQKHIDLLASQNVEINVSDLKKDAIDQIENGGENPNSEVLATGSDAIVKIKFAKGGETTLETKVKAEE